MAQETIDKADNGEQQEQSTWRDSWFIANVLAEFPIVNGVCKSEKSHDIFYYTSRSAMVVIIGTTVMMANLCDIQDDDAMGIKALKTAAAMSLGMAGGAICHNVATFFCNKMKAACATSDPMQQDLLAAQKGGCRESRL